MNNNLFLSILIGLLLISCHKEKVKQSFLALGDSYTIGESVSEYERWPVQLVAALENKNIFIAPPKIIAKTGWTTEELKTGIDQAILDYPYDWVSLLIGVNNQYRGNSISAFKTEFEQNMLNLLKLVETIFVNFTTAETPPQFIFNIYSKYMNIV